MLNSFKSGLEIDEFLYNYISSLNNNINSIDAYKHNLRKQIKDNDHSTLKNLLSFFQKMELEKIKK